MHKPALDTAGFSTFKEYLSMSVRHTIAEFEKRSVVLFAAITLSAAASTAWAQSTAAPMASDKGDSALFAQADKDGNKSLNKDEAKAIPGLTEQFAKVDANADGGVSEEEFMAAMKPKAK
jgi:hypothetical protein